MTGIGGMKIGLKQASSLLDTVVGLKDGSVRQQTHSDLGTQLLSSGPLANLLATSTGNVVFFATKAAMDAATDYSSPQGAWVFADDDPANNGAYYFTNGDPGYWTFMLNFPTSWIFATVSGGTANEIELSMSASASPSTMIFFEVQEANLGGGVTVALNGGDPMALLDFRGDALEADALVEGALAVFFPVGDGTARLILDNTAEAAKAAAAASASSANASAILASDKAIDASDSAVAAERFATAPEDEETSTGSGLYSAFHWAQKAFSIVVGQIADQISAAAAATPSAADIFAFVDSASGSLKKISFSNLIAALKSTGDMATRAGAETLTNKTLDGVTIVGPVPQLINEISASVAANALTLSILSGSLDFRSATLASGTITRLELDAALNLVVPSGATLGTTNGNPATLAVLAINDGGTIRPGVVNIAGGVNLDEASLISATAISSGASSASTIYSNAAVTSKAFRVVGFVEVTQTTAGTWAAAPTKVQGAGGLSLSGFGALQTWDTPSYLMDTTYYNPTNKTIDLKVQLTITSAATVTGYINGAAKGYVVGGYNGSGTQVYVGYFRVPPKCSFMLSGSGFSGYLIWRLV